MTAITLAQPANPKEFFVQWYVRDRNGLIESFEFDENFINNMLAQNDSHKFYKEGSPKRLTIEAEYLFGRLPYDPIKEAFEKIKTSEIKAQPTPDDKETKQAEIINELESKIGVPPTGGVPTAFKQAEDRQSLEQAVATAKALITETPDPEETAENNLADDDFIVITAEERAQAVLEVAAAQAAAAAKAEAEARQVLEALQAKTKAETDEADRIAREAHQVLEAIKAKTKAETEEADRIAREAAAKEEDARAFKACEWPEDRLVDLTPEQWNYVSENYPLSAEFVRGNLNDIDLFMLCMNKNVDAYVFTPAVAQFDYDTLWQVQGDRLKNYPEVVSQWFQVCQLSDELVINIMIKCSFNHDQLVDIVDSLKNRPSMITHVLTRQEVSLPLIEQMLPTMTSAHLTIVAKNGGKIVLSEDFLRMNMRRFTPEQWADIAMSHSYLTSEFLEDIKHYVKFDDVVAQIRRQEAEIQTLQGEVRDAVARGY